MPHQNSFVLTTKARRPELFRTVTGLTVQDFQLLVRLKVFKTEQMNQAVFAFRRYEDASLRYTSIINSTHPIRRLPHA